MMFAIIGSGNVATHLAIALPKSGHQILQVYSSNFANAESLAHKVSATAIKTLKDINQSVAAIILAVNDDALASILENLCISKKILIHTSGTLPLTILSTKANNCGVLYPLQTLSKSVEINFKNVPLCVEANNVETEKVLFKIANSISNLVYKVNSSQRKTIHIAAVFASNFTNYLYAIADDLLKQNQLSFDLLKPLIIETANKIVENSPKEVQTGPAYRNDKEIIDSHLSALSQLPNYQLLYKLISQGILANKTVL